MNSNLSLFKEANGSEPANDSSLLLQIYMDTFLCVTHLTCGFIGLPMNILLLSFIVHSRRLHKPRNIVWLGIVFSNIIILLNRLLELCAFVFQDETLCRIFIFMVGLPYAALLLNLFLALVDRYVAFKYSLWYKRQVRIHYIVIGQIAANLLLIFVAKFSYIFRLNSVDCNVNSTDGIEVSVVIHILIILCITGQILVYQKIKNCLVIMSENVNTRSADLALSVIRCHSSSVPTATEEAVANDDIGVATVMNDFPNKPQTVSQQRRQGFVKQENSYFVRIGNQSISRLELEAARNLTAGILSLCVFAFPSFLVFTIGMGCVHFFNAEECSSVAWASAYTSELNLLVTIYKPIFFVLRSRDFSEALRQSLSSFPTIGNS